jgi:integrase/recombinase XerD
MLSQLVDAYLKLRRSTGFRMGVHEYLLHSFASFAAQRGETHIRTRTAVEWAAQAPSEGQRANRLSMLRVFARFARAEDIGHEVPSERVFSARRVRYRPFIFTSNQLHDLLVSASKLPPAGSIRPWTFTTLFSLLATTGLRISEALNLRLQDITEDGLVIRETKFQKSRLVPLHPTASSPCAAVAFDIPASSQCSCVSCARWESIQDRESRDRASMIFVMDLPFESSIRVPATEPLLTQTCWL